MRCSSNIWSKETAHEKRHGHRIAVHNLDLYGFKTINDTHGHAPSDAVPQSSSGTSARRIRRADTIARLGGNEFAILQRDVRAPETARRLAERIIQAVIHPIEIGGTTVEVGVSIGIAISSGDVDPETVLASADHALYRSRNEGGNVYRAWEADNE